MPIHNRDQMSDDETWLREEHTDLMPHVSFDEFVRELSVSYSPHEGYNVPHYYVDIARRFLARAE